MGRKRAYSWRMRLLALALLLLVAGGGWAWWQGTHWKPERAAYPQQGVVIGERDGLVAFDSLRAIGAQFVYLEASRGETGRDEAFGRNLDAVMASGVPFGVIHAYDPCVPAERQAANFLTIVPRGGLQLPPAIQLTKLADRCEDRLAEAAIESELTTFLNQVEGHAGRPAVLKLSPEFQARYHIASSVERNLWLARDWLQPDYAGRPWTLWTANTHLRSEVSDEPIRWVVVQP